MDLANKKQTPHERRPVAPSLSRRLLHKFVRAFKECPDNRSTLGMHERIRGGRTSSCVRLVCGDAWPFGGKICVRLRQ
jgi:hypothetical protein